MNVLQFLGLALLACSATLALGESTETSLKAKIAHSLDSLLSVSARGIQNCENKCDKAFNRFSYTIAVLGNQRTYEFQACVRGCERCNADLAANADPGNCFRYCKDFNWAGAGITKGVIEVSSRLIN